MKKLLLIILLIVGGVFAQDVDISRIIEANNRFAINLY